MTNQRIADLIVNDEQVDLTKLTGRRMVSIPEKLHPVRIGETMASSLAAATGVDPRSGGLYDPSSMAAVCGGVNRYYLVNTLFTSQPEFTSIIHREGGLPAAYEDALRLAWKTYENRIEQFRTASTTRAKANQKRASKAAFEKRIIDLGSD